VDKSSEAEGDQADPDSGMPTVAAEPKKAAVITVPKGEKAPADLKEQVLIKGKGPKVEAGQGLIAQYTGVKWEDGKKFDSSWDHGGATAFQIGTGSVVQGWDKALVGKNVGDRVLIVIPPKLGYGSQPQSELGKSTLVFSVDIVGTV
jgi:FKBP-type peptidyl-prolyl cis-trans isomerase